MGVATRVTEWLRRAGHDVRHLRDEGLYRLPDGDVFRKAAAEQRVILTFDMDFGELFALSGERQASVILFRLHNTRSDHLVERLSIVLRESSLGPWSRGRSSWSRNRGTAFAGCQAADRNPATQSPVLYMLYPVKQSASGKTSQKRWYRAPCAAALRSPRRAEARIT
jgi:predicted nuclease of predicted toxin-antitoxin system